MAGDCSFDLLLSKPQRFGIWSIDDEKWLDTFREIFKSFNIQVVGSTSTETHSEPRTQDNLPSTPSPRPPHRCQKIPKLIHHIWLGSELPLHFRLLRQVNICTTVATNAHHVLLA
jgi:hypothetical protein